MREPQILSVADLLHLLLELFLCFIVSFMHDHVQLERVFGQQNTAVFLYYHLNL